MGGCKGHMLTRAGLCASAGPPGSVRMARAACMLCDATPYAHLAADLLVLPVPEWAEAKGRGREGEEGRSVPGLHEDEAALQIMHATCSKPLELCVQCLLAGQGEQRGLDDASAQTQDQMEGGLCRWVWEGAGGRCEREANVGGIQSDSAALQPPGMQPRVAASRMQPPGPPGVRGMCRPGACPSCTV